eukprot:GHVT01087886.1.p1 GENE.GHVT01087886.1~~GHVT01087886.1.p1  ORF type:complete len:348 (+),score=56.64 GHVT01087886.1:535-1578(+)
MRASVGSEAPDDAPSAARKLDNLNGTGVMGGIGDDNSSDTRSTAATDQRGETDACMSHDQCLPPSGNSVENLTDAPCLPFFSLSVISPTSGSETSGLCRKKLRGAAETPSSDFSRPQPPSFSAAPTKLPKATRDTSGNFHIGGERDPLQVTQQQWVSDAHHEQKFMALLRSLWPPRNSSSAKRTAAGSSAAVPSGDTSDAIGRPSCWQGALPSVEAHWAGTTEAHWVETPSQSKPPLAGPPSAEQLLGLEHVTSLLVNFATIEVGAAPLDVDEMAAESVRCWLRREATTRCSNQETRQGNFAPGYGSMEASNPKILPDEPRISVDHLLQLTRAACTALASTGTRFAR